LEKRGSKNNTLPAYMRKEKARGEGEGSKKGGKR